MLTELHIENIAVIEKADIAFHSGLTVLTGETGAGKSIIVDSLGAVLGARTNRELVRSGAEHGTVTAVFESKIAADWFAENDIEPEDEIIIRRRIGADGKSNCRVCGSPVSVTQLRELGALLLDIHGQNDGRQLMDESKHLRYLDGFGGYAGVIAEYRTAYEAYRTTRREIDRLSMDEIEKERLADNLRYQIEELGNAALRVGEEDELTARRDRLRNAEKLTDSIETALRLLYDDDSSAVSCTDGASACVSKAAVIDEELRETAELIDSASSQLYDAAERLRDYMSSLDFSPEEYDALEARLSLLRRLRRKYNADEKGMLEQLADCEARLSELEYSDDMLIKLGKELEKRISDCRRAAKKLSDCRRAAALELEKRIVGELRGLSMPSVRFAVEFTPVTAEPGFGANGSDEVRFLISANAGEELGRISRIASGGELSRIMLAMKTVFSDNDPIETMVFDEIDTGVSGIAAQRVGEKLSCLSCGKQVLCITHLPQIAALADNHELIVKNERGGRTYTEVRELDRQGRCSELARLHGGDSVTELTLLAAEAQLTAADEYKSKRNEV